MVERETCEELVGCVLGQAALAGGSIVVVETFSEVGAATAGINVFPKTLEKLLALQLFCGQYRFRDAQQNASFSNPGSPQVTIEL